MRSIKMPKLRKAKCRDCGHVEEYYFMDDSPLAYCVVEWCGGIVDRV